MFAALSAPTSTRNGSGVTERTTSLSKVGNILSKTRCFFYFSENEKSKWGNNTTVSIICHPNPVSNFSPEKFTPQKKATEISFCYGHKGMRNVTKKNSKYFPAWMQGLCQCFCRTRSPRIVYVVCGKMEKLSCTDHTIPILVDEPLYFCRCCPTADREKNSTPVTLPQRNNFGKCQESMLNRTKKQGTQKTQRKYPKCIGREE